jgi:hypothetical protein
LIFKIILKYFRVKTILKNLMTNLYSMSIVNLMTNYFKKWADREDSRLRRDIKTKLQLGSQGVLYMKAVVKDAVQLHGEMGFAKGQGRNQGRQAAASP